jgi:Flp pilus assembly protein TadD
MRSLGRKYLLLAEQQHKLGEKDAAHANYVKAVDSFLKSLALNSFQPEAWFSLGCAAQSASDYATAARAFRRKVDIDPEDYQSWNNLANSYVKLKEKPKAFFAFKV